MVSNGIVEVALRRHVGLRSMFSLNTTVQNKSLFAKHLVTDLVDVSKDITKNSFKLQGAMIIDNNHHASVLLERMWD